jgi:hypothetical protein
VEKGSASPLTMAASIGHGINGLKTETYDCVTKNGLAISLDRSLFLADFPR